MNENLQIIFGLLGGLAVFLFGMNMMSECLQKAAGEKMKSILSLLTKNPVMGVIAGALTTAVLQKQQRYYCYGDRLCQRGAGDAPTGDIYHFGREYRYDGDGARLSLLILRTTYLSLSL